MDIQTVTYAAIGKKFYLKKGFQSIPMDDHMKTMLARRVDHPQRAGVRSRKEGARSHRLSDQSGSDDDDVPAALTRGAAARSQRGDERRG